MKHQHRTAIGAGFGIVAIAGIAASGAFACTKSGGMTNTTGTSVAAPGQTLTMTSTSFRAPGVDGAGQIDVKWVVEGSPKPIELSLLASLMAPGTTTGASGTSVTYDADGKTTITVVVPADAKPLPGSKPYFVQAVQAIPGYDPLNAALPVFVPGSYAADPTGPGTPTPTPMTNDATTPGFKAQDIGDNRSEVPSIAGAVANSAVAAAERKAAPPVGQSGPSVPQLAEADVVPGVPTVSPVSNDDPTQPQTADPAELQLWSGLRASASPSSLLDGPQSAPTASASPAGVILLSMGGLALAGTGAAVGRRRLALAKAARR